MAMMGFIASIVGEATSGKGTLAQIGLSTAGEPNTTLLIAMSVLFGGATVAGTAMTVQNIFNRKMSSREIARCGWLCACVGGNKGETKESRQTTI